MTTDHVITSSCVLSCVPKRSERCRQFKNEAQGGFECVKLPSLTRPCVCCHVTLWKRSPRLVVPFMDCRLWSSATFSNTGQIVASVHTFTPPLTSLPCWDHLGLHVLLDPPLNSSPPLSPAPHRTGWCHRVPVTLHLPAKQELWVGKRISARHGSSLEPTEAGQGHSASLSCHRFLQQAGRQRWGWQEFKGGVLLSRTRQLDEELRKTAGGVL